MHTPLTSKQEKVLQYYKSHIKREGYAPSYRVAGIALGLDGSVVHFHVNSLKKKGYVDTTGWSVRLLEQLQFQIPILGTVACGSPIAIHEEIIGYADVPKTLEGYRQKLYALKAVGESMKDAGINDGDTLIIRQESDVNDGDIAVVAVGDYADDEKTTLKRVYKTPKALILKPANDVFPTQVVTNGDVRGKLVYVSRTY